MPSSCGRWLLAALGGCGWVAAYSGWMLKTLHADANGAAQSRRRRSSCSEAPLGAAGWITSQLSNCHAAEN